MRLSQKSLSLLSLIPIRGIRYVSANFVDLALGSSVEDQLFTSEERVLANYDKLSAFAGGKDITVSIEAEYFSFFISAIDLTNNKNKNVVNAGGFEDNSLRASVHFATEADTEYLVKVTRKFKSNYSDGLESSKGYGPYDLALAGPFDTQHTAPTCADCNN